MERKILPGLEKKALGMSLLALAAVPVILASSCTVRRVAGLSPVAAMNRQAVVEASRADLGLLTWPEQLDAVRYELELLDGIPLNLDPAREADHALYRNSRIYSAQALLPLEELRKKQTTGILYYRVRAFDLDGQPLGNYSQPVAVESSLRKVDRNAPVPRSRMEDTNGSLLLYPVYAYTGNPGAVQYEVEVTDRMPENPEGIAPSRYRVFAQVTSLTDLYDEAPRLGTYYWRVRGMDKEGNPVGQWSLPQKFTTLPSRKIGVGIYGDSISHGGGHLSFSPVDYAYSYSHYLAFPTVNLSESGDTSAMMVERFERDVRSFHLKYLLILGGTNSLRAGVPAEEVIQDLDEIGRKAEALGIRPIYLTLPPINPANIQKAFDEPTADNWRQSFAQVNAFIRSREHIDVAASFENGGDLPTELALDGIHGDWNIKQEMAQVINEGMKRFGVQRS